MKILRKYALLELAIPFLMSLAVFTFIFLVGSLLRMADLLVNKGVSPWDLIEIISLLIPKLLSFTLPTAALTAILLVFGSFAQNNEILAMKAVGVNLFRVMLPVLVVCFIVSLLMLFLNDQVLPKAQFAYRKAIKELIIKKPTAYLQAGRFVKDFKGYIVLINKIDGEKLEGVTIYQPQEGKPTRTIIAERGEVRTSEDETRLIINLYNGTSDEPNPENPDVFYKLDFKTFEMPPIGLSQDNAALNKKVKDLTIDELLEKMQAGNPELKEKENFLKVLQTEFHKKISFSFAALFLVLVGLPLAVITRRGEAIISFSLSIAVIAIYYIFFVLMKTVAIQSPIPAWIALWLPNGLMVVVSYFLMRRVIRL
jgi:lipopolysaccharide export system permease protein